MLYALISWCLLPLLRLSLPDIAIEEFGFVWTVGDRFRHYYDPPVVLDNCKHIVINVGFEVLTAVAMRRSASWDTTTCSPL
jgi:hypothetical protein